MQKYLETKTGFYKLKFDIAFRPGKMQNLSTRDQFEVEIDEIYTKDKKKAPLRYQFELIELDEMKAH